jgi:hypothetical protein
MEKLAKNLDIRNSDNDQKKRKYFFWPIFWSLLIGLPSVYWFDLATDIFGIDRYLSRRKDVYSKCDFSYYSDVKELESCITYNYKRGSEFSLLHATLIREGYGVSFHNEAHHNLHNALLGQGQRIWIRQIHIEEKNGKIVKVTLEPYNQYWKSERKTVSD